MLLSRINFDQVFFFFFRLFFVWPLVMELQPLSFPLQPQWQGPGSVSLVVVVCFRPGLSARHLSQESAGTNISVAGTFELSESLLTICLGRSSCHFLLSLLLSARWGADRRHELHFFSVYLFLCQTKFVSMPPVLTARLCFQVNAQRSKGLR